MFKGSIVALITPMAPDGTLDEAGFENLIDWQIDSGTAGLVPCGTTGESPTLTHAEHYRMIEVAVAAARKRVPVIAGTGSNSTAEAIETTRHARASGADAALVVTPYYNKPTQDGLYRHYMAIADAVDLPIVIYNIPGRSVIDMSVDTMARLAKHPNIVGVKDSTANLVRPLQIRRRAGTEFNQLSGEDGTAIAFLATGGHGCISVTANIAPALCAKMHAAWEAGEVAEAIALQDRLLPLHDALFLESNPAPVKYGASLLELCSEFCRLPLAPIADTTRHAVRAAMEEVGLLG
ncbi:4-hydroxy-tetrahydrodipicolinate synthase [Rhizosaccharibacter radicis]|uniref:4-hydroxy-tetrahydrodipicolinate synthase n=1 Tax=Rhizosaccharibacter radicis TaxID=2782605 RepID=A0ABT1VV72_9PROT|nr:4-hydroxy-tetrahydrodipicolinate synthase [Acetobacteraceae bacterium KSS12]